jgi:Ca-activated chloride channel family protein
MLRARFCWILALAASLSLPAYAQTADAALLVLLDVSGSMKESVPGGVKRELARKGLMQTLASLPEGTVSALRLLGQGEGEADADECTASRTAVAFSSFDPDRWTAALDSVRWDGATPLVHSMRSALADLRAVDARRKEMLIIGDGAETCGEDPVGVARAEAGGVRIHTISLGERTSPQLAGIALVTDGTYSRAYDDTTFDASVSEALPPAAPAPAVPAGGGKALLEVVLDVSNSMWGQVEGRVKMELAREALSGALAELPADFAVALRAYGHRVPYEDDTRGCEDTELLVPPDSGDPATVLARASALQPTGQTPIALSLRAAADDLRGHDGPAVLLLISDGVESCGGDPVAAAEGLRASGLEVVVHTVGLGVDAAASAQLKALAAAGGGEYFDAPTAADLVRGVDVAVRRSTDFVLAEDDGAGRFPRDVVRVRGGDSVATAQELIPGTYSFEDHLWKEMRYFQVAGTPGERLLLQGMISALAIGRTNDGAPTFLGDTTMFMADRLDSAGEQLRGRGLLARGDMGDWAETELVVGEDGWARFRIGRPLGNVHRDAIFRLAPR